MCTRLASPQPLARSAAPAYADTFAGRLDQIRYVRAALALFLKGCPAADDAVLLVSELAANAIAHSASSQPGGTFSIRACLHSGAGIYAEVEDQGSPWSGDISHAEAPHGLFLLRALSTTCGTQRGEHGWLTWFTIAL